MKIYFTDFTSYFELLIIFYHVGILLHTHTYKRKHYRHKMIQIKKHKKSVLRTNMASVQLNSTLFHVIESQCVSVDNFPCVNKLRNQNLAFPHYRPLCVDNCSRIHPRGLQLQASAPLRMTSLRPATGPWATSCSFNA